MTPATVSTYPDLIGAIAERRRALGLSQLEVDARTGLPDAYQSKIEARMRNLGNISLPCILGALGLEIELRPVNDN